jgi:hypothetical protein
VRVPAVSLPCHPDTPVFRPLLAVYAKNEREDLTTDQKKQINRFVEAT